VGNKLKTLMIYASVHHGNTQNIGKIIAESLNADIISINEANVNDLNDYDLIGFGSGIYYGKFHKDIIDFINKLPISKGKKAFVFSTSGFGKSSYNNPIENKLKEKGYEIIGSFACKGYDTYWLFKIVGGLAKGRPNNEDIQNAKNFAQKIIETK
jgi:flavodoxin